MIKVATALAVAAWASAWLTGSTELFVLAMTITVAAFGSLLLAASVILEARHEQRFGPRRACGTQSGP